MMLRKFVYGGVAAAIIAVAGVGATSQPAEAGVHVSIGLPGFFGYWGPAYYPGYYTPYPAYPAYYGGYYGAPVYYYNRGYRNYYYDRRHDRDHYRDGKYHKKYYK